MKIEVKTYEESRLEFFKDLARKAEKKLDKCIRAMKQSDYDNPLSENHLALDDALEKKSFYADIVCMLFSKNHTKWISVKERLPDTEVLALNLLEGTYGYEEIIIGYVFASEKYDSGFGAENDFQILENVTHWMPLPKVTLKRTPPADVDEVVRCKNCRHSALTSIDGVLHCFKENKTVRREDYCSCGERKIK